MSRRILRSCIGFIMLLWAVAVPRPAVAGRCAPLCRAFDIADARSLPWGDEWWQGKADYDIAHVVADTEGMLTPDTPVIVRMETIRRAALYASRDRQLAEQLLARVMERARATERAGQSDALAWFDAAYLANTLYQIGEFDDVPQVKALAKNVNGVARDIDAYALVQKSLALRPNDAEMQFGAALIASLKEEHHPAYYELARKARAGAQADPLLARNLRFVS